MDTMPQHFRLRRESQVDVQFEGELLADVSSREDDSARWNEIRIYSSVKGTFIVENVGVSLVDGERDRSKVTICHGYEQIVAALQRGPNKFGAMYLTDTALEALDQVEEKLGAEFTKVVVEEV
jgi:IS4 transposase